jgi:hypothetical protein
MAAHEACGRGLEEPRRLDPAARKNEIAPIREAAMIEGFCQRGHLSANHRQLPSALP